MKVILRSRQTKEYLQKADIISVDYRDRRQIPDLIDNYKADIIVKIKYADEDIDWKYLDAMNKMLASMGRELIACLSDLNSHARKCEDYGLKFYYGFPVDSLFKLRALKDAGVCAVRLAPPLTHMMDQVAAYGLDILAVPNIAYNDGLPRTDGVRGGWIRPEDLTDTYLEYIDMVEFEDCDNNKEQALYRLYFEEKAWPGDLGMIITNLNYPGVNRMIPPDLAQKRANCGQRCLTGSHCNICYRFLDLANPGIYDYMRK